MIIARLESIVNTIKFVIYIFYELEKQVKKQRVLAVMFGSGSIGVSDGSAYEGG